MIKGGYYTSLSYSFNLHIFTFKGGNAKKLFDNAVNCKIGNHISPFNANDIIMRFFYY